MRAYFVGSAWLCLLFLLSSAAAAPAQGTVTISLDPSTVQVTTGEPPSIVLVPVSARIACQDGQAAPPAIAGFVGTAEERQGGGSLWQVAPKDFSLHWVEVAGEPDVYEIQTTVQLRVTSTVSPDGEHTATTAIVTSGASAAAGEFWCHADGYAVEGTSETLAIVVTPASDGPAGDGSTDESPSAGAAMALMVAVAGLAAIRRRM